MNDDPLSVPRPSPRTASARPQKKNLSQESRFIGYVVLSFGLLAVVALVLIVTSGGKDGHEVAGQQRLVPEMLDTKVAEPPPPRKELFFEREPDFDAERLVGAWQAQIGKFTAAVQFDKGTYQIILAQTDPAAARLYSSGTYKVMEDIVLFTPRLDWPPPKSKSKITYSMFTRAPFPVIMTFDGKKMLWQNPPQSEKRVLVPYKSPVFMGENVDFVSWSELK